MDSLLNRLPKVPNCCFCISLDVGALIIGYVQLIIGAIEFILDIVAIAYAVDLASTSKDPSIISLAHSTEGILGFDLVVQVGYVIIGLFLVFGVHKKNPRYVFVWLVGTMVIILLKILAAILVISYGEVSNFVSGLISILLTFYFLLVVNTVYQDYETGGSVNY